MSKQVISQIAGREAFITLLQNNPGLIILKLGAEWCGPCKKVMKLLRVRTRYAIIWNKCIISFFISISLFD